MAKAIYINRTKYTKEYQKKVAMMNVFSRERISLPALFMMINMFMGTVALRRDPNSVNGWIMMLMGFIIFPLFFLVLPYFMTLRGYKRMTSNLENNEFTVEAEFTNNILRLRNSIGQTYNVMYEDIQSVEVNKSTMIIKDKNSSQPTYLDINSFVGCTYEQVKEFLDSKMKKNS